MDFSTFSHILYNRIGNNSSEEDFVQQLFFNIVEIDSESDVLERNRTTFIRYYTGKISIDKIAKEIKPYIDKQKFQDYLVSSCNEDLVILLIEDFANYGYIMDKFNYDEVIANVFLNILSTEKQPSKNVAQPIINNTFINGELIPREILNTPLSLLNTKSAKKLNDSISIANILATEKLPEELKPYYNAELRNNGVGLKYMLVPKTVEAEQKYPIKLNFKFSPEDNAIDRIKNIPSLQNEANRSNKKIEIGHPYDINETVGDLDNPLPFFPKEDIKSATLYIMPTEDPITITVKLYMYDNITSFKLENVTIQRLEEYDGFCRFSNARFDNDWFDFILDLGPSKVSFHILPRKSAIITASRWLQLYQYRVLMSDSNATIRLSINGLEKPLFEVPSSGNKVFTPKESRDINDIIEHLKKLVEIEDKLGLTFDFDFTEFANNLFAVDLLYYVLKKKKKSFSTFTSWICEGTGSFDDDFKAGSKLSLTNDLSFVELFGKRISVNGMQVYIKDAIITNIDYSADGFIVRYTANHVTIMPKK